MHGYNFIENLLDDTDAKQTLSVAFIGWFVFKTPKHLCNHDAMGLTLMGGEL